MSRLILTQQQQQGVEIDTDPVPIRDTWRIDLLSDETLNDSDKSFTTTADTERQYLWIWVEFTSTATAGDRQLVVEIQDSASDVIGQVRANVVQAASLTRYYMFGASLANLDDFYDTDWLMTPLMPGLILQGSDILRIYDNNAVDAAADDMVVQAQYASRAV